MAHLTPATPTPHGVGVRPRATSAHPGEVSCHAAGHRSGQVDANVHALSYPQRTCSSSRKEAKNEHPQ